MNRRLCLSLFFLFVVSAIASAQNPHLVVYEGSAGPGRGKHIVFLAGDHEYRSEEALPALARIMAQRYGFKCSVFFTTNPATGFIEPGSSHIAGLEALKSADLLVVFLRFQDFPDAEMQHIADYLERGGPVVGFRTATHAFQIKRPEARFRKFDWQNKEEFAGGFGRQVLGETWVSHYGRNHRQSSRLLLQTDQASPPDPAGRQGRVGRVRRVHCRSDAREHHPGPRPDPRWHDAGLAAGARQESHAGGVVPHLHLGIRTMGRVFTTTHGASEDLRNDGFRRMAVNALFWAAGLEAGIQPTSDISFVGPYQPTTYAFDGYVKGMKPADLAGWDTPIPKRVK